MRKLLFALPILALGACSTAQNAAVVTAMGTPAGQLFCAIQLSGGGTAVVAAIDAEASALAPASAPVAIIATGASEAVVNADCAKAGPGGIPVSPPTGTAAVPNVAVVVSAPVAAPVVAPVATPAVAPAKS